MGVAGHLRIEIEEYDQKIRTFVPHYETLLEVTANSLGLLQAPTPKIIDLGIGTGALTESCLAVSPHAHVLGVDTDSGMLAAARHRLLGRPNIELIHDTFLQVPLPPADAVVASLALHHVPEPEEKKALYRRIYEALRPGGIFASGDCFPSAQPTLAAEHHNAWLTHLARSYSRVEAEGYLQAWSGEDTYFPLASELDWLREAEFTAEVLWRADGFAVVAGIRER
jgi:tRNA (cmo5U34)-methyltransferase